MSTLKPGPYISEDYDEVYLPVAAWTYNDARSEAAGWANEYAEGCRSRYTGKRPVPIHDHEDWEYCEKCPAQMCWTFTVYEGSPVR